MKQLTHFITLANIFLSLYYPSELSTIQNNLKSNTKTTLLSQVLNIIYIHWLTDYSQLRHWSHTDVTKPFPADFWPWGRSMSAGWIRGQKPITFWKVNAEHTRGPTVTEVKHRKYSFQQQEHEKLQYTLANAHAPRWIAHECGECRQCITPVLLLNEAH